MTRRLPALALFLLGALMPLNLTAAIVELLGHAGIASTPPSTPQISQ